MPSSMLSRPTFPSRLVLVLLLSLATFFASALAGFANAVAGFSSPESMPSVDTLTITNRSGTTQLNYPLQFGRPFVEGEIPHFPQLLINGYPVPTQADVKNRYPDGSVEFAVISVVIPTIPATGSLTVQFGDQASGNNTPLSLTQMLDRAFGFDAQMILVNSSGVTQTADARQMLAAGSYKLWTSGPVAQTIMLADDSASATYDLGFDGYRPFRPRFYATFWPATNQVTVRYVGENGNTQNLEDLAYTLTLTTGTAHQSVYTKSITHYAMSNWTKVFWLGGRPTPQINIDYNLPYLISTKYLPNYDTSISIPNKVIATEYWLWIKHPHDLYDGVYDGGLWTNAMGTTGERPEIGPYPAWTALWFYTGDWRMRQMALGMADLASAWPANLREGDSTKDLLRTDPSGAGTGLGHVVSVSNRPSFTAGGLYALTNSATKAADKVTIVGPLATHAQGQEWVFDGAHQPDAFYPQYILSGDPYYLNEMYMWAGFSAARYDPGKNDLYGRGPTGVEGGIADQLRGAGWVFRNRVEAAFAAPDDDPEKVYFTTLSNDAIARWEGGFGIADPDFDGTAEWQWGYKMRNFYSAAAGGSAPRLDNWGALCNPTASTQCSEIIGDEKVGRFVVGAVGSYTAPWMQYYPIYALGRARDLGFATNALLSHAAPWLIGLICRSGNPLLVAEYELPVVDRSGNFFDWSGVLGALTSTELSTGLPAIFLRNLKADGYDAMVGPALSYLTDQPGGAQAWSWFTSNVYNAITNYSADPKWAILPAQ
jgi:hypothetical protein